jgi:hypothetical protein
VQAATSIQPLLIESFGGANDAPARFTPVTVSDAARPRHVASAHPPARGRRSGGLDLITDTPPGDEGSCEGRITEIDR